MGGKDRPRPTQANAKLPFRGRKILDDFGEKKKKGRADSQLTVGVPEPKIKMASDHQATVEREVLEIQRDIKRIGQVGEDGKHSVKFGVLFEDEKVEQYYEAIVGTLKAAKKRGYIDFKGQMLLKGAHDDVDVILVNETLPEGE